jgi:hypothetical protein
MNEINHVFLVVSNTKSEKDTRMIAKAGCSQNETGMMENKKIAYLNGNTRDIVGKLVTREKKKVVV